MVHHFFPYLLRDVLNNDSFADHSESNTSLSLSIYCFLLTNRISGLPDLVQANRSNSFRQIYSQTRGNKQMITPNKTLDIISSLLSNKLTCFSKRKCRHFDMFFLRLKDGQMDHFRDTTNFHLTYQNNNRAYLYYLNSHWYFILV